MSKTSLVVRRYGVEPWSLGDHTLPSHVYGWAKALARIDIHSLLQYLQLFGFQRKIS